MQLALFAGHKWEGIVGLLLPLLPPLSASVVCIAILRGGGRARVGGEDFRSRIRPHLGDLEVVVARDARDRDDQAADVDDAQLVVEDDARGADGDDFLEDAADGQRDHVGALEEGEFGCYHAECEEAGDEKEGDGAGEAFVVGQ